MKKLVLFGFLVLSSFTFLNAQRGKDGAKTVSASEVVNAYTTLTANASVGNTSITVANSALNTNFTGNLGPGDLIMIIQVQGATVEDTVSVVPPLPWNDSRFHPTWGRILDYNNCGNYEFVQVLSVPNNTTINLDCPLTQNYTSTGNVMVIRVPRYSSLTINGTGTITADTWNGTTGGVLSVEVDGPTIVNPGGRITADTLGFRGGRFELSTTFGGTRYAATGAAEGGEKGEGIAGDWAFYDANLHGRYARGAAANGGGGGDAHNAGGGGGANASDPINSPWNTGVGVPSALFNASWPLETPNITGVISSGGGRGGYSHCTNDRDETSVGPGNALWGGDTRREVGGLGGRPLDYSTGKIFMGGGGGAGDGEDQTGGTDPGDGGNGGGIVFMNTYGDISGGGTISANGQDGFNCEGPTIIGQVTGKDAAGGGGGGGTIIIKTTGNVTGVITSATGGNGGNQVLKGPSFMIGEAEGPGGGGGGGYIAMSHGNPTRNVFGGTFGETNSAWLVQFPANGATSGGDGDTARTTAYDITVTDDSICQNTSTTLTASITGTGGPTVPTFQWYDAPVGGNLLFTGSSYTTPILAATTTYYVRVCPAPYRAPVTVTVTPCPTIAASFSATDSTLCVGDCIDFTDLSFGTNPATGWTWSFPGATPNSSSVQNPTNICYNSVGSFNVQLIVTDGSNIDTLLMSNFITVSALPVVVAGPDTSICIGDQVNLRANGATTYFWDNSLGAGQFHTPSPTVTTNYHVTGTDANGCTNTDSTLVTINPLPTVVAGVDTAICIGDQVNLSATGATSYFWDNSLGAGQFHSPSPTVTTNYHVTGTDANGCTNMDSTLVTVNPLPTVVASPDTSICIGDQVNLSATGASTYFWDNSLGAGQSHTPSPTVTTNYHVTGTDANGCSNMDSTLVTINPLPTVIASNDTTICSGDTITVSATGATTYFWNNSLGAGQSHSVTPGSTITYTVTGTDANSCTNTDSVVVTVNPCGNPPVVSFSATDSTICLGDCIDFTDLSTGAPSGWTWYFFGATPNSSSAQHPTNICYNTTGTFDVALVATNTNGQDSLFMPGFITVNPLPILITSNDTSICIGDTVTLWASGGGITYTWDNGLGVGQNHFPTPTVSTTYHVTATDANGCSATDSVVVTVTNCNVPPIASIGASNTSICIDDCIDFTDLSTGGTPTSWSWYLFGGTPDTSSVQNPGNICYNTVGTFDVALTVSNAFGQDSIFLSNYITVDSCNTTPSSITIPNVFSPNGDGHNDLFVISNSGITSIHTAIYNRWGQLIFESSLLNHGWDGRTTAGSICPEGTYFYLIEADGETYKGTLTLVR